MPCDPVRGSPGRACVGCVCPVLWVRELDKCSMCNMPRGVRVCACMQRGVCVCARHGGISYLHAGSKGAPAPQRAWRRSVCARTLPKSPALMEWTTAGMLKQTSSTVKGKHSHNTVQNQTQGTGPCAPAVIHVAVRPRCHSCCRFYPFLGARIAPLLRWHFSRSYSCTSSISSTALAKASARAWRSLSSRCSRSSFLRSSSAIFLRSSCIASSFFFGGMML